MYLYHIRSVRRIVQHQTISEITFYYVNLEREPVQNRILIKQPLEKLLENASAKVQQQNFGTILSIQDMFVYKSVLIHGGL